MKNGLKLILALGMVFAMSMPVLGLSLAAPKAAVPVHELRFGEGLTIDPLAPFSKRDDFYGGQVLPVRVLLTDNEDALVSGANVTIWVDGQPGASPAGVNSGNHLKELHAGLYMFSLDTKPYPAGPGSPPITIMIRASVPGDEDHPADFEKMITLD